MGVHSGRKNKGGVDHPTLGCIRVEDDAMEDFIVRDFWHPDPLQSITVTNCGD